MMRLFLRLIESYDYRVKREVIDAKPCPKAFVVMVDF